MAKMTNEIVKSKQNQEQKKEVIDKYGALLHNPKRLQEIMRWRLFKIGKSRFKKLSMPVFEISGISLPFSTFKKQNLIKQCIDRFVAF